MADPHKSGGLAEPLSRPVADAASEHLAQSVRKLTDASLGYLSLEEMLSELLERVRAGLGVDTAAVLLLDHDRDVLVARAAKGIEEEVREGVQLPLGRGFAGRIAAEGRPRVIEDVDRAEILNPLLRQRGIRSLLGVPLHVEDRVIGVLHVGTLRPRAFDEDDTRLLQLAADRAALAIEAAQLAERRAVTEALQRTLLPLGFPQVPGLRFSAKYLPAGSGIKVGGDWYDVFPMPDGRVGFVIGDVAGRGVVAASVMAEIRTALRAYALEGHDLATVISLLNGLVGSIRRNHSATAAFFSLDLESEQVSAVSAGHLPALLLGADGGARFLAEAEGPPLGLMPGHKYIAQTLQFPTGSALVLYTDGLIERRDEPVDRGLERLASASRLAAAGDETTFADRLYKGLAKEISMQDDIALLVVESLAPGPCIELSLEATPTVLASLRRAIGHWLIKLGVAEAERFAVILACSEAAGNAIEHAYGPQDATFTVACRWSAGEVRVTVSDTGAWRRSTSQGRGRGLMLMREFMDSVNVEQTDSGTVVTLIKRVAERS
jgi:serine phosphatase RsbU (regulator of sigma subunit)/anti-sigma regulatory factor (Ser/Thr protein kinase)